MLDRITSMQVFARVAALGSLSAAARALGMSQTMATKHVAALEDRLGVRLLLRTTRRLTLTEAGRRYLDSVERILLDIDEAEIVAAAERVEARGTLRVNAPVSFAMHALGPILAGFAAQHPAVSVELGLSDRVVDLIEEGWDVAIRIGQMKDSGLMARRLAPCRLVVCAAPDYLARHGRPRSLAELGQYNCLSYTLSRIQSGGRWLFGDDGEIAVPVSGNLRAGNGDVLLSAAIAGQGLIYEPTFLVAEALRAGRLVALGFEAPMLELPGIFAVHPASRLAPAKVSSFISFIAEALAGTPPWDRDLPEVV